MSDIPSTDVPRPSDALEAFDRLLNQETKTHKDGMDQGTHEGAASGFIEGFSFGFSKGAELGNEIGFYQGFLIEAKKYYESMNANSLSESTQRKVQSIAQLSEIIRNTNLREINRDGLSDNIIDIRRKFKQVFPDAYKSTTSNEQSMSF